MSKLASIIIIALLLVIVIVLIKPDIRQDFVKQGKSEYEKTLINQAEVSISAIKTAYRVFSSAKENATEYSIEEAIDDAGLSSSIRQIWDFEVIGYPPTEYIAKLKTNNTIEVHYYVQEMNYQVFGID